MSRKKLVRLALAGMGFLVLVVLVVGFVYRPWALSWGSTDEEIARPMPGDEVLDRPTFSATRAVTIEAPPEAIWPWIVQIGYRRAGFYSYDVLDNDGIPSAERILPEFQTLQVGDTIPLSKSAHVRVTELEAPSSLVLVFEVAGTWSSATWVWGLYPVDASRTRLVTRLRADATGLPSRIFLDLGEIIMMRKCMLGIKRRAEKAGRRESGNSLLHVAPGFWRNTATLRCAVPTGSGADSAGRGGLRHAESGNPLPAPSAAAPSRRPQPGAGGGGLLPRHRNHAMRGAERADGIRAGT